LAFQTKSLLVCGFAASAVRRNERAALGKQRAQVALCCAVRRWLLKRRRRQRRPGRYFFKEMGAKIWKQRDEDKELS
jgi:hypothetical protein